VLKSAEMEDFVVDTIEHWTIVPWMIVFGAPRLRCQILLSARLNRHVCAVQFWERHSTHSVNDDIPGTVFGEWYCCERLWRPGRPWLERTDCVDRDRTDSVLTLLPLPYGHDWSISSPVCADRPLCRGRLSVCRSLVCPYFCFVPYYLSYLC